MKSAPLLVAGGLPFKPRTDYAIGRMLGSRDDAGMSNWSVRYILENGITSPSTSVAGRYVMELPEFGKVITESDGTVMNVIPYTSAAGEDAQGWFVEMMIALLVVE